MRKPDLFEAIAPEDRVFLRLLPEANSRHFGHPGRGRTTRSHVGKHLLRVRNTNVEPLSGRYFWKGIFRSARKALRWLEYRSLNRCHC